MIHFNGNLTDDTAIFEFQDRIRLGDGVFDTALVINGKINHADAHFERLIDNAKMLHFSAIPNTQTLKNAAQELIESNESLEGRFALNTLMTRGVATRGLAPDNNAAPNIAIRITPAPHDFPDIHAIISETVRRNEGSPLSNIKSCNYGDNILALLEAQEKEANEAILLNNNGNVTCASAGNIFCCIDGNLITPPLSDGVMDGVTRKTIIEKFQATERSISRSELESAQGIYITNSIKGVMPVSSLNGTQMPEPAIQIPKDAHIE